VGSKRPMRRKKELGVRSNGFGRTCNEIREEGGNTSFLKIRKETGARIGLEGKGTFGGGYERKPMGGGGRGSCSSAEKDCYYLKYRKKSVRVNEEPGESKRKINAGLVK